MQCDEGWGDTMGFSRWTSTLLEEPLTTTQSNVFPWACMEFTPGQHAHDRKEMPLKLCQWDISRTMVFYTVSFMMYLILFILVRQKDREIRRMVDWRLILQSLSYHVVMWCLQVLSGISHSKHVVLHLKVKIYQLDYWTVMEGKIREQDFRKMPLVHWSCRGPQRLC